MCWESPLPLSNGLTTVPRLASRFDSPASVSGLAEITGLSYQVSSLAVNLMVQGLGLFSCYGGGGGGGRRLWQQWAIFPTRGLASSLSAECPLRVGVGETLVAL